MLALHGWLDNAASFDLLAPLLPGIELCALDFAGHGLSEHRPAQATYHYIDNVADALAAADALGWGRFALIGHSMGAGIATLLAAVAPERVTRVVLIEGLGPMATPAAEAPQVMRRALHQARAAGRGRALRYPDFEHAVQARIDGGMPLSASAAAVLCRRALRQVEGGFEWRSDPRLRWTSRLRLTEDQALAFIGAMQAPTRLIRARDGLSFERAMYERRAAAHPQLEVATLPGTHHLHLEEHAPLVAAQVAGFLND